ncbi:hypothetical protein PCL_04240 [Purpureocillium lilacinum]|uniref:Uncharacterized protein n=1 Tax=Purpureocillium lilacinum TaxID=33203 RepID=A0A2U3DNT3_PURLI|nr:hypothetical protein PCL_04240 [Purpureocillium lilacinum]
MVTITEVTKVVDAPIGEVWAIISAWGSERFWFPNVIKSTVEGSGVGAKRTLTFGGEDGEVAFEISEQLQSINPATHTISYICLGNDDPKRKNPYARMTLEELSDGGRAQFKWAAGAEWVEKGYLPELKAFLDGIFGSAIDSIGSKLAS